MFWLPRYCLSPGIFLQNTPKVLSISFVKCLELKNHSSSKNHPSVCGDHIAAKELVGVRGRGGVACSDGAKTSRFEDYLRVQFALFLASENIPLIPSFPLEIRY